jgi:hypothetical protein
LELLPQCGIFCFSKPILFTLWVKIVFNIIDNLPVPDLILLTFFLFEHFFYLSYFPYGGQTGSRSMQEQRKGQRLWSIICLKFIDILNLVK